jgi:hypothetical protein
MHAQLSMPADSAVGCMLTRTSGHRLGLFSWMRGLMLNALLILGTPAAWHACIMELSTLSVMKKKLSTTSELAVG